MMWYPQHPQISVKSNIPLLRAVFFIYFCGHPSYINLRGKINKQLNYYMMGGDFYPVQKLKQLEMGRAGSEMKRESNLGTGWWFRIQWIEAMFVWTALCTTRRNPIQKHHLHLWYTVVVLFWWCSWCSNKHCPCFRQDRGGDTYARTNHKNNNRLASR